MFSSFRTSWNLFGTGTEDSRGNPNAALKAELDFVYASGGSIYGLDSSDFMRYNGTTFTGPIDIQGDYELYAFSASLRPQFPIQNSPIKVSPIFGIGAQQFHLKLSAQGLDADDRTRSFGPLLGLQLDIELMEWLEIYGRLSETIGLFGDHYARIGRTESGVAISPFKNLSLVVGWTEIKYVENRSSADVDAGFSGPLFGVHLDF